MKNKFLSHEFWILSWNGSVQRALRYSDGVTDAQRADFKKQTIKYCEEIILPSYKKEVDERTHKENIIKIRNYVSKLGDKILHEGYKIGNAQKLLNLYLKYLWASGLRAKPPHCPVDSIILSETKLKNKLKWTQMDSIEDYESAIAAISEAAKGEHIADWELDVFNRRNIA